MITVFDPRGNPTGLIDQMIGTAFPIVREVAENIEYIKHLSHHMPEVYAIWEIRATLSSLAPNVINLLPIYDNLADLIVVKNNVTALVSLSGSVAPLVSLNTDKQELLDAETYIRSFEAQFGNANGAFAQATATAVGAASTATTQAGIATEAAGDALAAETNIDAFLMATTTEQVRMAAFIVEINNRTLV